MVVSTVTCLSSRGHLVSFNSITVTLCLRHLLSQDGVGPQHVMLQWRLLLTLIRLLPLARHPAMLGDSSPHHCLPRHLAETQPPPLWDLPRCSMDLEEESLSPQALEAWRTSNKRRW